MQNHKYKSSFVFKFTENHKFGRLICSSLLMTKYLLFHTVQIYIILRLSEIHNLNKTTLKTVL